MPSLDANDFNFAKWRVSEEALEEADIRPIPANQRLQKCLEVVLSLHKWPRSLSELRHNSRWLIHSLSLSPSRVDTHLRAISEARVLLTVP